MLWTVSDDFRVFVVGFFFPLCFCVAHPRSALLVAQPHTISHIITRTMRARLLERLFLDFSLNRLNSMLFM